MDIQREKIKQEFWNWAKVENPRMVENAELGDVYAIQNLDHMFMGFAAAKSQAVPEWVVMVPKLSANYLFSKVPELGFKHKDEKDAVLYHLNYMASEFNAGAKSFVEQDHAKQQTMFEAQEQSNG